ncbi:PQQ-dependent sugar dehydrogenase [Nocardioides sp. AE5]|uniref:PQQ-dependent sugar dehydrogenase n=1 Tax=Nocardioides sp. AE5 TaxID=2962573 RepID=UPI002881D2D9|nr:PQQ-dependent sugar dehydrogenase [Nocardioides sp. AE5]MDT0202832.1 PQQ-dependent sugar dehydrogenase [Nocardioides sp. AE5]
MRHDRSSTLHVRLAALALGATLLAGCGADDAEAPGGGAGVPSSNAPSGTPSASPDAPPSQADTPTAPPEPAVANTVVSGLAAPWGLDFLPDGTAVVTERDSRRVLVIEDGQAREIGVLSEAVAQGEAGLLGIAVSPDFDEDQTLFLYLSTGSDNRIVKATFDGERLGTPEPILTGIPHGFTHDGGRLAFGPDGYLYASTGDSGDRGLSQDEESLGGKILRMTPEGDPAPGNPDGGLVWSLGHRNVQGLAFDETGQLWASEFGDKSFDEVNRIEAGGNYGWPQVEGTGGGQGLIDPHVTWPTDDASPSGLAYAGGHLWMASLRGERLWRVTVTDGQASDPTAYFVGDYGRLRTVAVAPNGNLWLTTSNRDGRGDPAQGDDRILELTLE